MIKCALILLLFCIAAHADGPLYRSSDTITQREFVNVYQDLRALKSSFNITTGTISSLTVSTLTVNQAATLNNAQSQHPSLTLYKNDSGTANQDGPTLTLTNLGPANTSRSNNVNAGSIYFNFSQPTSGVEQNGAGIFTQADGTQSGTQTKSKFIVQTSAGTGLATALTIDGAQKATFVGDIATSGNLSFSTSGDGIVGTTTNDSASAGKVGEPIQSVVSAVSLSGNNVITDVASIALSSGDWDVSLQGELNKNGGTMTTATSVTMGFSSTAGTTFPDESDGDNTCRDSVDSTSTLIFSCSLSPRRTSIASNTTYKLKAKAQYSAGTPVFSGRISARRVR